MDPRVYSRRKGAEPPPRDAVYVGRPTLFGNPFIVGVDGDQGDCVEMYRTWVGDPKRANLRVTIREQLGGRDLVCWCAPKPCHADVLLEIANP